MPDVNISVQLVPLTHPEEAFAIIDEAIALIKQSGIKHEVGPMETTLEGDYKTIMNLIEQIKDMSLQGNAERILLNIKVAAGKYNNITMESKTHKHR